MSLMGRIKAAWAALVKKPGHPRQRGAWPVFGTTPVGAAYWTDNRIEQARHFRYWVHVAVDCFANKVAQASPLVSRRKGAKPSKGAKSIIAPGGHDDLEPVKTGHPVAALLANPNPLDSTFDFFYELAMFERLMGTAYIWIRRNGAGLPAEAWVVPSHWVMPRSSADELVAYYDIRPIENYMTTFRIEAEDMITIKSKSPISKVDGFSKLTAGARWVDSAEAVDASRRVSFEQGVNPSGVLEIDESFSDPSPEEIARIESIFRSKFSGSNNAGRLFIAPKGAKLTKYSQTPLEMDFVQSADQMRDTVLALYGTPKTLVGITEDVNRASMEASLANYAINTINPFLARVGQSLSAYFSREFSDQLVVWYQDCAPPDAQLELQREQFDLANGVRSVNELRVLRGLQPYPHGGDDPLVSAGLVPVGWATGEDHAPAFVPAGLGEEGAEDDEPPELDESAKKLAAALKSRGIHSTQLESANGVH